jgi:hypothetical protein
MKVTTVSRWAPEGRSLAAGLGLGLGLGLAGGCATFGAGGNDGTMSQAELVRRAEDFCAGIPAQTREQGLLAYRDSFASAAPLSEDTQVGKTKVSHTRGETIALRASPNVTLPWLGRVNRCHVALVQAGRVTPTGGDLFAVPGTTTAIEETYAGYVLSITGAGDQAVKEVVDRTHTLMAAGRSTRERSLTAEASRE